MPSPGYHAICLAHPCAVLDHSAHFQRICAQLAACPGQQANESELKVGGQPSPGVAF